MHARYCSPFAGRFLSVDRSGRSIRYGRPQSWNRYSYVLNNPLKYIDPFGEAWFNVGGTWTFFEGIDYIEEITVNDDGTGGSKTVKGVERLVGFDGSRITIYNKDGSKRSFNAVSGRVDAEGRTQPGRQRQRNVGPIPEGRYSFNPAMIQNFDDLAIHQKVGSLVRKGEWPGGTVAWGKHRVELTPDSSTNTHTRSGFFIHGGLVPGSAGCIDLCGEAEDFFDAVPNTGAEIPVFVDYP
jgi:hypothetical protein